MEGIHLCLFMMLCLGVHKSSSEILQRQKRDWIINSFKIQENSEGPFPLRLGTIKIAKNFTLFQIEGQGVKEEPAGTLEINEETGEVTVLKPVDYEAFQLLKLTFKAVEKDTRKVDTQLGVEIIIVDVNDNSPNFVQKVYNVIIPESTLQGTDLITIKAIDIDSGTDGEFDYRIAKVTPEHENVKFFLKPSSLTKTATIFFRGCLEHKTAKKYSITVVATDHGKNYQLSNSSTVIVHIKDGNNHFPKITGKTGLGRVKEGQENVTVFRLHVKDEDSKGTDAWKAKYKIHGDSNNNFKIITDSESNDGLLVVEKPLDYEDSSENKLNITVENEMPFYSCKVKTRKADDLWVVMTDNKEKSQPPYPVTVHVEDVNDAPVLHPRNKKVSLKENAEKGRHLVTFTAKDHEKGAANKIVFKKEADPADWVTVDPKNGKVTSSMPFDRESSFVKNNTYIVNIIAVDNGVPAMTGTATLTIYIVDDNDNTPYLPENTIDVCQSDKPSKAILKAIDLDEGVYSGPFSYRLLGDVKGKWSIDPAQGYSVNLVKESKVHSGHYELALEVSDLQLKSAVHNLSVTVCECTNPEIPNCRVRKSTGAAAGGTFIGVLFLAFLLVAGILLLAFLISCKKKQDKIAEDEGSGQQLMICNTETPGDDCKVKSKYKVKSQNEEKIKRKSQVQTSSAPQPMIKTRTSSVSQAQQARAQTGTLQQLPNYSMGVSSSMRRQQKNLSMHRSSGRQLKYSAEQTSVTIQKEILPKVIKKKLYTLQAPGEELVDYVPHAYAEEQNTEPNDVLDAISIPDIPFDPDMELDSRFVHLASICSPHKNTSRTDF
ncbi:cadherin-2-like [Labrus mixtus]|uniref:cadherin-2-like n=1 Tax=Labrus mixtus TaxID=508554 RepID=UPI0029C08ADA|nr:cadherin-2-like [Labrus mixtus]